jgi:DNA ligase-1
MISRAGKPFGNANLPNYFNKLFQVEDYVLDGELYCDGINFNKLQTILNTYEEPLPNALKFVVYDCVPVRDWEAQKCNKPYSERIRNVREVLAIVADYKKVIDIPNDEVQDAKQAVDFYKDCLKKGYEGAMIKAIDGQYRWKRVTLRSGEMLKIKPFTTVDLKVTGVYDGEGNFQGMAGGVVVDFNGNAVSVGSGFDVATRKKMAESPDDFIGRTAEVKYFEVTQDGSLRFPTFVRWRDDK